MANFSTEFSIDDKNSIADVIQLACKWVTGSPHTAIPMNALQRLPSDSEQRYSYGTEEVTIAIAKLPEYEIGGLRYIRVESGIEWTTLIVTHKTPDRHLLSIQVLCEAINTAVRLPPPKKPYFVRQALTTLGGGMDGEIPVADKPFVLLEEEVGIAAPLIMSSANNKLPIVYISAGFDGKYLVDANEMARMVSGMAHVVVEPSRTFSFKLKTLTNARNAYGGNVGVYWPESSARKSYFLDDEKPNSRALQVEIAKDIRLALSNRRARTSCTWVNVKETISRKQYDAIKARGSTELQEYVDAFDADQKAMDAKVLDAEREISRLNAELKRATLSGAASHGVLNPGKEHDLYENEIKDILVDTLTEALQRSMSGSRRQHVIAAFLEANRSTGRNNALAEEIKSLFKTYRDMDSRTRNALARMGFDLSEDGKHYKTVFQGDGRYTFILPKTSGDHRVGKNIASDINKTLF